MKTPFGILILMLGASVAMAADDTAEIRKVLETQQTLWNAGDAKGFTAFYTDDTRFVSTQVQRGRQQVEERYAKRYPNRAAMGKLTFDEVEITKLGKDMRP